MRPSRPTDCGVADLDVAIAAAAEFPAAWYGTVEVRPVHPSLET